MRAAPCGVREPEQQGGASSLPAWGEEVRTAAGAKWGPWCLAGQARAGNEWALLACRCTEQQALGGASHSADHLQRGVFRGAPWRCAAGSDYSLLANSMTDVFQK